MSRRTFGFLTLALGLALLLAESLVGPLSMSRSHVPSAVQAATAQHPALASQYGQLPLAFEVNEGQAASPARFLAHGSGYTLALTPTAALLALAPGAPLAPNSRLALPGQPELAPTTPPAMVSMQWLGANPNPVVTGEQPLPGTANYFLGNDPRQWHTNIPTYQQVRLHDVYPGIDLDYYGTNGQLEYDFVVAPGASPAAVQLAFTGASGLGVDLAGNLSVMLPGGTIQQQKPLVYQTVNGARQTVGGGYTLETDRRVQFTLGAYNPQLPLVIDPAYKFSTYLGGSGSDFGYAIAVDAAGNAYATGETISTNFPTNNPLQASNGGDNVFVTKFNAAGTALIYSTYLGGNGGDFGAGIALDANDNVYLTGLTGSTNFPTVNPVQATNGGGNAFVTKINAAGSALVYSTYLGGSTFGDQPPGLDEGTGIAVDSSGDAYVTGIAQSSNFPTTVGAFQTTKGSYLAPFVSKFNAAGSALVYSTLISGIGGDSQGLGIAVDSGGDAYITGFASATTFPITAGAFQTTPGGSSDGFVTKLNASGSALVYSTYLGGSNSDDAHGIALDGGGNAYITGNTLSIDFPTTVGAFQTTNHSPSNGTAYLTKLNAAGSALVYSTYLGGSTQDTGYSIALDSGGDAYVAGVTSSTDFPTVNPLQASNAGSNDYFVSKFNSSGSTLLFSTYLGGSGNEVPGNFFQPLDYGSSIIAVGTDATAYLVGTTLSTDFPTANAFQASNAGSPDAFVTKLTTRPSVDTTTGVFRPSNGVLYLKNANTTGPADISLNYGLPGDLPITGDWTGKGYKSIGIYRNGTFYLRNSNTTGFADITVPFGASGDVPVAGDWTGKGYDSIGVYKPSTSTFYLRDSNTSGPADHVVTLGISGDVPIVGDWTGKGWDSVGVFRPSNGIVYLRNSNTTGIADISFVYGIAGDKPVVGDWDGNGTDTIGVDRGGRFLLRNSNSTGPANASFYLGVSGDDPIAGPWLAPVGSIPPVHRGPSTPAPASPHAVATTIRRGVRR